MKGYDYSSVASYMLTFNTINRAKILSEIIPGGMFAPPEVKLLPCGIIAEKYISMIEEHYPGVKVDSYVIMPDHVHLLVSIEKCFVTNNNTQSTVARIIHAVKALTTKEIGETIWQLDFYDVIAETEEEFLKLDDYIYNNPASWLDKEEQEPYIV